MVFCFRQFVEEDCAEVGVLGGVRAVSVHTRVAMGLKDFLACVCRSHHSKSGGKCGVRGALRAAQWCVSTVGGSIVSTLHWKW